MDTRYNVGGVGNGSCDGGGSDGDGVDGGSDGIDDGGIGDVGGDGGAVIAMVLKIIVMIVVLVIIIDVLLLATSLGSITYHPSNTNFTPILSNPVGDVEVTLVKEKNWDGE